MDVCTKMTDAVVPTPTPRQEARVVIISTVLASRNANDITVQEQLGFLGHPKRFNVAVTRAQALTVGFPYCGCVWVWLWVGVSNHFGRRLID